jgi:hypothetical protein
MTNNTGNMLFLMKILNSIHEKQIVVEKVYLIIIHREAHKKN